MHSERIIKEKKKKKKFGGKVYAVRGIYDLKSNKCPVGTCYPRAKNLWNSLEYESGWYKCLTNT